MTKTMVKTGKAKRLLIQLMVQADEDFMSLDFDRMTVPVLDARFEDYQRQILFYENQLATLTTKKKGKKHGSLV